MSFHQEQRDPFVFKRGDKVIHVTDCGEEEEIVGTVLSRLENGNYLVEFKLPGRKKKWYRIEVEFEPDEIIPCYVPEPAGDKSA